MVKALKENEIVENLKLLADWLRVKCPGEHFELIVAGGINRIAMAGSTGILTVARP